jgi:6-methylsalicylate decarboxylase
MSRIDCHAHFTPPEYDAQVTKTLGPAPIPAWDTHQQLEMMARYGIAASVVSVPPPGVFMGDGGQAKDLARAVNEAGAGLINQYPKQFAALAALPLPDVNAALDELTYALDVLKLDGVALFTHIGDQYLGNPAWSVLFDELNRRGAYVFVHPALPAQATPLKHLPSWLIEFPFETTRAITNLLYSGTFARCPNIKFQFAHMGGAAPFLAGRIASLVKRAPPAARIAEQVPAGPLEYLKHLYYDTGLSNNAPALAATLQVTMLDHILLGLDWPYADLPAEGDPAPGLAHLGATARAKIEWNNAAALVPRLINY